MINCIKLSNFPLQITTIFKIWRRECINWRKTPKEMETSRLFLTLVTYINSLIRLLRSLSKITQPIINRLYWRTIRSFKMNVSHNPSIHLINHLKEAQDLLVWMDNPPKTKMIKKSKIIMLNKIALSSLLANLSNMTLSLKHKRSSTPIQEWPLSLIQRGDQ